MTRGITSANIFGAQPGLSFTTSAVTDVRRRPRMPPTTLISWVAIWQRLSTQSHPAAPSFSSAIPWGECRSWRMPIRIRRPLALAFVASPWSPRRRETCKRTRSDSRARWARLCIRGHHPLRSSWLSESTGSTVGRTATWGYSSRGCIPSVRRRPIMLADSWLRCWPIPRWKSSRISFLLCTCTTSTMRCRSFRRPSCW